MLPALATYDDLDARNIIVPSDMDPSALLDSASAAIRDAAGCAITQTTSTVTLIADDYDVVPMPAGPVQAVSSVTVNGVALTGWRKVGDILFMPTTAPRWTDCLPAEVTVVYTHGYGVVPADIVDLCCGICAIAFGQDGDYAGAGRQKSIRLGEFSESSTPPVGAASPSPMALPDAVRQQLRARFGTSVAMVKVA